MRWRGGYFNGVVTAPLLLLFAIWLAILQLRPPARPPGPFLLKRTLPAQQPDGRGRGEPDSSARLGRNCHKVEAWAVRREVVQDSESELFAA